MEGEEWKWHLSNHLAAKIDRSQNPCWAVSGCFEWDHLSSGKLSFKNPNTYSFLLLAVVMIAGSSGNHSEPLTIFDGSAFWTGM